MTSRLRRCAHSGRSLRAGGFSVICLSHVYSLGPYSIKEEAGKFFVAPTGTTKFGKPHKTLRHACTAIARKLEAEYVDRKNRRLAFNKKYAVKRRAA